jgi:pSer/pThr/pTyr-binding forkhead associated (FHA) protein
MKPPSLLVQLVHIHGPMKGQIQEFTDDLISIGRNPACGVRFPAEMTGISRKHAELRREGNQFKLTDFSTNGIYLNGKKVKEAFLKDGDVLEISAGGPKVSFLTSVKDAAPECRTGRTCLEAPAEPVEEKLPVREDPPVKPQAAKADGTGDPQRVADAGPELPTQKVKAPLIIQYGPTIRSFKELPITIGKNPGCDFILPHSAILDRHAQILFSDNRYWIKDLSGRNLLQLNNRPIEFHAPLSPDDQLSLSPQGPVFCFLGQGRLAEVAQSFPETDGRGEQGRSGKGAGPLEENSSNSFWSRWKK